MRKCTARPQPAPGRTLLAATLLCLAGVSSALPAQEQGARYLIVSADEFVPAARVLAEWKTSKGMLAKVVPASMAGGANNPDSIRAYIRQAWLNWPIPPEHVLILGSPTCIRAHEHSYDTRYGDLAGDYEMEIPVGRLPAENLEECYAMVNKTVAYENPVPGQDTLWYLKGTTTVSEDGSSDDTIYWNDARTCHRFWIARGYAHIDSFSKNTGGGSPEVDAAARDGRAFITYRGLGSGRWWPPFREIEPRSWDNGPRLPVVLGGTCATVTLAPYESMYGDQFVRAGTSDRLGGAVAYFGTTQSGGHIARQRSNCFRGFFRSLFEAGEPSLGLATLNGRQAVRSGQVRYEEWNLLGDPELNVWTGVPQRLEVEHDTVVDLGPVSLEVLVRQRTTPVPGAVVCVSMDSTVHAVDTTDDAGRAVLDVLPHWPGELKVVVTGRNLMPYKGRCLVWASGRPYVVFAWHGISDPAPGGNDDSCIVAGETARMLLRVKNHGESPATGVKGLLTAGDSLVALLDSVEDFGDILPGAEAAGQNGLGFRVSNGCEHGHVLRFRLVCEDDSGRTWESEFRLVTGAPELVFRGITILDSAGNNNGRLDPGETADLRVTLGNSGYGTAHGVWATLRRSNRRFYVLDSVGTFGRIPGMSNQANDSDRFCVFAWWVPPGTRHSCTLRLHSVNNDIAIPFEITIGDRDSTDPVPDGPREPPLYWAYDDVDSDIRETPEYDWHELRGIGQRIELGPDQSRVLHLPVSFGPFRYYDVEYRRLTVSSNGWLAPGSTDVALNPVPCPLPNPELPAFLAPYWHEFDPRRGGGILWYHDTVEGRVTIEWDSVYERNAGYFATFQFVLYDTGQAGWGGNSEFVYQYKEPNAGNRVTVGLQDPYSFVGITVVHQGVYEKSAASIVPGRAIKFTTDGPYTAVREQDDRPTAPGPAMELTAAPVPATELVSVTMAAGAAGWARLGVYDLAGREVCLLLDGSLVSGHLDLVWDGRDAAGRRVPAGVYFLQARTRESFLTRKLILRR
ncbi:MAG: hypothetical protein JSU73_04420 [candidate division WOR-3 bacterium]|nr:MAG: hypothetical protein JSU73_04420 [candidate division WOR-3 bacterium]